MTPNENDKRINEIKQLLAEANHQIYSILRHVSASGMSREISFYVIVDNQPRMIDWAMHELLGYKYAKGDGVKVSGCGMDMGFHLVYSLSRELYCKNEYNHEAAYKLKNQWL